MASLSCAYLSSSTCCTDQNPRKLFRRNSRFLFSYSSHRPFPPTKTPFPLSSRAPSTGICRCESRSDSQSPNDDSIRPRWNSLIQDALKNAVNRWKDHVNRLDSGVGEEVASAEKKKERMKEVVEEEGDGDWDWDRWRRHFDEVEEQERIVSILKLQLGDAVQREDYYDAAKLKVAMAAASRNDTVGRAMSQLKRAVVEERYQDAAFIRDNAGAGLVGWWAGVSKDSADPYGRIIHITAEHGRYVARSYNSRQLASASPGVPLFEVFFTVNNKGEYKHQAVYLKRNRGSSEEFLSGSLKSSDVSHLNSLADLAEEELGLSSTSADDIEDEEKDNDSDAASSQSIVQDMIPGFKFVPKVLVPGKLDGDLIFKALEQESEEEEDTDIDDESIVLDDELKAESEEEDGERNMDFENSESYNELKAESDRDEVEMDTGGGYGDSSEEERKMVVKAVAGTLAQDLSSDMSAKDLLKVPARIEKNGRLSFSFSMKKDGNRQDPGAKGQPSLDTSATLPGHHNIDHIMSDLAKVLFSKDRKPKISMKVLKNVGDLLHLTLKAQSRQSLSGSTVFNRIEIPATSDPLNGLYVGSHVLYSSGIIHLRRKFGQWQEDSGTMMPSNLEFYEYVEALKLTGDPYVPAGEVAFRAKIGKRNQLPHKGIIPEEFGVVARYRGQGRLAESGFRNPRWVDGEFVVLDGKYIKGGPVVGFVYWAPEYHFLMFFNRLKLHD